MSAHKPVLLNDSVFMESHLKKGSTNWNWIDPGRGALDSPANYYEASLNPWPALPALENDLVCDVLVIGGGLLGSSTALHLSEAGIETVLVEKGSIGSAASGRNGGQLTPGLARWEAGDILEHFSPDEAKRLWRFCAHEAMDLVDEIAARYDVGLDRRYGHITAAIHPGHMASLIEGADARYHLGDNAVEVVGRHQVREHIASELYHGALIDRIGGQAHPLALVRTLAHGFLLNGGRIFEGTEIAGIEQTPAGVVACTASGTITARKGVVLAVHDLTHVFDSQLLPKTIPFFTYVSVTKPIDGGTEQLLPTGMPVYDTQFQIDYYRPVRKDRILFGGQGTGTNWSAERINDYLLGRFRTVFPQYEGVALDYSWSGISDFTLNGATETRRIEGTAPVYMVHGWSGHGVAQTVRIGKAIADDLSGHSEDLEMLLAIQHKPIPLGRQLSPFAIPAAKAAFGVGTAINPGKLVSF